MFGSGHGSLKGWIRNHRKTASDQIELIIKNGYGIHFPGGNQKWTA